MLAPRDKLTICFAHGAYRMAERFAARDTGIRHFQTYTLDEFKARVPEAHVVVVSMMWRNELLEIAENLQFIQSISAGLDASTVTPGIASSALSLTTPAMPLACCACAAGATATSSPSAARPKAATLDHRSTH